MRLTNQKFIMAKFKSALLSAISGTINGLKFGHNPSGPWIAPFRPPTNPNTISQQNVRQKLSSTSGSFRALTSDQIKGWIENKGNFPLVDALGDTFIPSGQMVFNSLNLNLGTIGEAAIADVPVPVAVPGFDLPFELAADTTSGTWTVSFTPPIDADTKIVVTATAPISAGITFVSKADFRIIAIIDIADVSPKDLATDYIAKFGQLPPAGAKSFVQFKPIDKATGIAGIPIKAAAIAI